MIKKVVWKSNFVLFGTLQLRKKLTEAALKKEHMKSTQVSSLLKISAFYLFYRLC